VEWIGPSLAAAAAAFLIGSHLRKRKVAPFARYGWLGLGLIAAALLFQPLGLTTAAIITLPLCWTGCLLAVDAALAGVRGGSLLQGEPEILLWMCLLSLFSWLPFEVCNALLPNWTYVGLPANPLPRYLILGWLFATITPALFVLRGLLGAAWGAEASKNNERSPANGPVFLGCAGAGALLLLTPLLLPRYWGVRFLGLTWIGAFLLADALNARAGRESSLRDLGRGGAGSLGAALLAGFMWGILGEFWNEWAEARRLFVIPGFENWRFFESPPHRLIEYSFAGPAMLALYRLAAATLDLPRRELQ
jgi:hypothetical protein